MYDEEKTVVDDPLVTIRLQHELPLLNALWQLMRAEVTKLGFTQVLDEHPPAFEKTEIKIDDFDNSKSFYGQWRKNGTLIGSFIAHANGNAFVEMDILQPHPENPDLFIEATTAWGTRTKANAELRFMPMP